MSEENLETVRQVYMAADRRDAKAVLALYHPDIEWDASRRPMVVKGQVYVRHARRSGLAAP